MNENQKVHSDLSAKHPIDTTHDDEQYYRLYKWLGKYYPESDLVCRSSQAMHMFKVVLKELRPFAEQGRVLLDAGCGSGLYAVRYCEIGGKARGIDISEDLIARATSRAEHLCSRISFGVADLQEKIKWNETFDLVLFTEVLEHLNHPGTALKNLHNALAGNGHMIVTTPTPLHHSKKLSRGYMRDVLEGKKVSEMHKYQTEGWEAGKYGAPDFVYRHSGFYPKASKRWIEGFGFKCLYYYTISSHIPGVRKALAAIPLSILRNLYPYNLFGSYNIQVFVKVQSDSGVP